MKRRYKIKNRLKLTIILLVVFAVVSSGLGGLFALTGLFGGSGSESSDLTRGLVGHWSMDDAGGVLVKDQSGQGNDGMINDGGSGNPVAYWDFDDGSGTTATDKIGSYNGTLAGPTWTQNGKAGGALAFDGVDDYVSITPTTLLGSAFSISAWVKISNNSLQTFFSQGITDFYIEGTLKLQTNSAGTKTIVSAGVFPLNQWVFITVTKAGNSAGQTKLYINAVQDDDASATDAPNTGTTRIGNESVNGRFVNGQIDDVRVYNYARAAAQVKTDYLESYKSKWVPGVADVAGQGAGTALEFDGKDDYVEVPDNSTLNASSFSTAFWVYKVKEPDDYDHVVDKYKNPATRQGWSVGFTPSATLNPRGLYFSVWNTLGNEKSNAALAKTLAVGVWRFYSYTFDGSTLTYYEDGISLGTVSMGGTTFQASSNPLTMGALANGVSNHAPIKVDDVRYYNRAISAEEVRRLYNGRGPVARWTFDEGSGDTAYDSAGSNDGDLAGSGGTCPGAAACPTWSTDNAPAVSGGSLSFDGTDDYVDVGDSSTLKPLTAMTVSGWVRPDSITSYGIMVRPVAVVNDYYWVQWNSTETYFYGAVALSDDTDVRANFPANTPVLSQWTHIVMTYAAGDRLRLYANGIEVAQSATSALNINNAWSNTKIGGGAGGGSGFFDGLIDDVRIYDYARTPDQVRLDYNAGLAARFGGTPDLKSGLVGQWKFDEMTGTSAQDSSGNGSTGTLANSPRWAQGNTASQGLSGGGGAVSFDGANDYVNVGNNSILNITGDLTLSAWFKATALGGYHEIISKFDGGAGTTYPYEFRITDTGALQYCHGNGVSGPCKNTTATVSAGAWYHVVAVRSGSTISFYINGILDSNQALADSPQSDTTNNVWIGWRNDSWSNGKAHGLIDDVRVYNRAITAEEIRYLYNNNGPIAHWKLDEGSGATAYDSVGSNDGTLTNMEVADWVTGKFGAALDFDGSNEYITRADQGSTDPLRVSGAITVGVWIKPDTLSGIDHVVNKEQGTGGYVLGTTGSNIYVAYSSGTEIEITGSGTLLTGQWQYISFTYDGANIRTYINGVLDKVTAKTGYATSGQPFVIGSDNDGGVSAPFDGLIDDVRLYNYARTAEQVRADYNAGLAAKFGGTPDLQRGLVGYWDFDESAGSLAQDRSGNDNDGMFNDGGSGNPVSYWDLEDGTGQSATDRIGSNNGTLGASSSASTDDPAWTSGGRIGKALEFDGVADYLYIPTSSTTQITGSLSVAFWAKRATGSTGGSLVIKESTGGSGDYWVNNPGTGTISCASNGGWGSASTGVAMEQNQWYHIAFTIATNSLKCYVNGELKATDTDTNGEDGVGTATSIFWGRNITGNAFFRGFLDDMRLYNYVLTDESVKRIYQESATSKRAQGVVQSTSYHGLSGGGNAMSFDGKDDFVEMTDSTSLRPTSISVSAWINLSSPSTNQTIVTKTYSDTRHSYDLRTYNGNIEFQILQADGNTESVAQKTAPSFGSWYHVVGTYDGTTVRIYVDGVAGTPTSITTTIPYAARTAQIGASYYNGLVALFKGTIDDVRIYNRALTAEEVRYLYNNNGPIAHWKLDENAGTTAYDSAGSNDGTLTNMEAADWVVGKFGSAVDLDGSDEYVTIADSTGSVLDASSAITLSSWIMPTAIPAQFKQIVRKESAYVLELTSDHKPQFNFWSGTALQTAVTGSDAVQIGQWYHLAATYNGSISRLFVNGVLVSEKTNSGSIDTNNSALQFGIRNGTDLQFTGRIDDVKIYNYARTTEQIRADYNAGKSLYFR
jgi:hypothetical protein